jgi:RNA polymerase sigma factor FliA
MDRDALIEQHRHLVPLTRQRAVPRIPPGMEAADLEGAGYVGLVQAADRFDPARGVQFKSLAITKIRGAMLDHLRQEDWVPSSVRRKQKAGEPVQILAQVSLEEMLTNRTEAGEDGLCRIDQIPDPRPGPEATVVLADWREKVWTEAQALPQREREVLQLYYGEGLTMERIGQRIRRSESRAYQLHAAGLARLRERETMVQMAETNGRREWTPEEDEHLRREHGQKTYKEIGLDLGRTVGAVQARCYTLGLVEPRGSASGATGEGEPQGALPSPPPTPAPTPAHPSWEWLPHEDERLLAEAERMGIKPLASLLGRSEREVRNRLQHLREKNGGAAVAARDAVPVPALEAPPLDPELAAMQALLAAFAPLDERARARVLRWVEDRFGS